MSGCGPGFPHSGVNFLVLIFSDERLRAWIPSFRHELSCFNSVMSGRGPGFPHSGVNFLVLIFSEFGCGPGFPHSGVNFLVLIFSDEWLRAWIPSFRRELSCFDFQ
jgi:hypothetical protein